MLLARRALDTRLSDDLSEAMRRLAYIDSAGAPDLDVRLSLSRIALAREETAVAEAVARRALELAPSSPAAHLALAHAIFLQPKRRAEGARSYFEGLQLADSSGLDPYLRDIEPYLGQHGLDALLLKGAAEFLDAYIDWKSTHRIAERTKLLELARQLSELDPSFQFSTPD